MPRELILGTAGHIDHGKTSLVKALTGVDTDRLPEEKARGITIDIGFASLDLGDFRLGIVDVPGHERFIKNMLAGATGVDLAVLVVAADDSVMPQTREHLEILRLLGLKHGVVALTKCDLVDADTRGVVAMEVRELVRDSFLADAPIIETSTTTGQGLDELKSAIAETCRKVDERAGAEWFRLAIDRSFTVHGHGTVVTGSVVGGNLKVGDEVEWQPRGEHVRVRALHHHDQPVESVHRGMRAAINLAGVAHDDIHRGQELATPGYLFPSRTLTVRVHASTESHRPLRHRTPVRLHLGTAEILGTVSLLDRDVFKPGEWGLAQLFLESPATAVWGQPFVLRESSAATTLGGGRVVQPVARKIRRRHLAVIEHVEQLCGDDLERRALMVAWFGGFAGCSAAELVRSAGIVPDAAEPIIARLRERGQLAEVAVGQSRKMVLHADLLRELEERVLTVLGRLHEQFPLVTSHDRKKVQAQLDYIGDDALVHGAVDRLLAAKRLVGDARRVALADFKPKLSQNQRKLKDKVVEAHAQAHFQPPEPGSFANQAAGNAASLKDIFEVCVAEGLLVRITEDIYLHADAEAEMRRKVEAKLTAGGPGLTVAEIRDLLGTTRKYAVPLCEYLDRAGVTRRSGDLRVLAAAGAS
jgi:selenocysteine-specific elongation factor